MLSKKPRCEILGIDHEFTVISVNKINPFNAEFMISAIPPESLYSETWYQVTYECSLCNEMKWIETSEEEAEKEKAKIS